MIRMVGRTAEIILGCRIRQTGYIMHQAPPHPLNTAVRRWAIRLPGGTTIVLQEDKFIVRI